MNAKTRKLYEEAKDNKQFQEDLKLFEYKYHKPTMCWSMELKIIYASVYMGWLIGKGMYNENNYEPIKE